MWLWQRGHQSQAGWKRPHERPQGSGSRNLGARHHPDRRLWHALLQLQHSRAGGGDRARLVAAMGVCGAVGIAAGQRPSRALCRALGGPLRRRTADGARIGRRGLCLAVLCACARPHRFCHRCAGHGADVLLRALQHRLRRNRAARWARRVTQHHASHVDRRFCVDAILAADDDAARAFYVARDFRDLRRAQFGPVPADPCMARSPVAAHGRKARRCRNHRTRRRLRTRVPLDVVARFHPDADRLCHRRIRAVGRSRAHGAVDRSGRAWSGRRFRRQPVRAVAGREPLHQHAVRQRLAADLAGARRDRGSGGGPRGPAHDRTIACPAQLRSRSCSDSDRG